MQISELFAVRGYGVVVTGGASGLGLAYAEALAENGARVTILDLNAEQVAAQSARLKAAGHDVRGAAVNVTDHAALDAADRCGGQTLWPPGCGVRQCRR